MADKPKTAKAYQAGPAWTTMQAAPSVHAKLLPDGPSCQPCADCGGLTCLCRPRFFAGQLLTEKDLNQLDSYIKAKNQLHNRHLFGSGVVCGLEVRCGPCGDGVSVTPGYALSPCGDDIVVCKTDQVDICSLISQCGKQGEPDCRPYAPGSGDCQDLVEDWILAIRYEETPSRGITALTGAGQGCGCSCGGSSCTGASNCGCGGSSQSGGCCGQTHTSMQPIVNKVPRRGAPPACEPTLTCESYRYEVFRAPVQKPRGDDRITVAGLAGLSSISESTLFQRVFCCMQDIIASIPPQPKQDATGDTPQWRQACLQWLCTVKQILAGHFRRSGNFDCEIPQTLANIALPDPNSQSFIYDLEQAYFALVVVMLEELIACVCSAALPPCPPPGDPRVPLALVSVRRGDCGIVSVCNWTPLRQHVLTFPTLNHWFGWIPIGEILRTLMHEICCNTLHIKSPFFGENVKKPAAPPPPPPAPAAPPAEAFVVTAAKTGAPAPEAEAANPNDAPLGLSVGNYAPAGPAGTFSEALVQNLNGDATLLRRSDLIDAMFKPISVGSAAMTRQDDVDQLAGTPAMRLIAEALRPLAKAIPTGKVPAEARTVSGDDLAAMRGELAGMRQKLSEHEDEIARLKSAKA